MAHKKDVEREQFASLLPKVALDMTIELTRYRNRPFLLIIWSDYGGEYKPMHRMFMTERDVQTLRNLLNQKIGEFNNGNETKS